MEHVGIDLGARRSHVVTIDSQGKITRTEVKTSTLVGWLRARPASRVVMEACTQSPAIATVLYAIWKHGKPYAADRASTLRAPAGAEARMASEEPSSAMPS